MRGTLFIFCMLFGLSMNGIASAAEDQTVCRHFIDTMHGRADHIFHDASMNYMQKQAALSGLFQEGVDISWVARFVSGTYWNTASPSDRQAFLDAYTLYLTNHYIGGLSEDDINGMENFVVQGFAASPPHSYLAHIDITQKADEPMRVDLTMEEDSAGTCRVRDFTAEGVSLLQSQSDQIQSLAAAGGLKNVTQKLTALTNGSH